MFTGIITAVGRLEEQNSVLHRFSCPAGWLAGSVVGDSIAINGVCLTITALNANSFTVDVCEETRQLCAPLVQDEAVNLEQALALGDKLGGHFVTGHVDGMATLTDSRAGDDGGCFWQISPPPAVSRYIAKKSSVALAGVALTVNAVDDNSFTVYLIPHTLTNTVLSSVSVGGRINIEADLLARHVGRLIDFDKNPERY